MALHCCLQPVPLLLSHSRHTQTVTSRPGCPYTAGADSHSQPGAVGHPRRALLPPPRAAAVPAGWHPDNAYFSDDDVSSVDDRMGAVASPWIDANYLNLSVVSYRLMQSQSRKALHNHFQQQQQQRQQQQQHRQQQQQQQQQQAAGPWAPTSAVRNHQCCAENRDNVFSCGSDDAVAAAVSPAACFVTGHHFLGTPPLHSSQTA